MVRSPGWAVLLAVFAAEACVSELTTEIPRDPRIRWMVLVVKEGTRTRVVAIDVSDKKSLAFDARLDVAHVLALQYRRSLAELEIEPGLITPVMIGRPLPRGSTAYVTQN